MNLKLQKFDNADVGRVIDYCKRGDKKTSKGVIINVQCGRRASDATCQCFNFDSFAIDNVLFSQLRLISSDYIGDVMNKTCYIVIEVGHGK